LPGAAEPTTKTIETLRREEREEQGSVANLVLRFLVSLAFFAAMIPCREKTQNPQKEREEEQSIQSCLTTDIPDERG